MTRRSTKSALLSSVLALFLCITMLVGTTFAWFTDSVTSANNIIKSGNLDIELYFQVEGQTDWTKVTDQTNVFKTGALWEPGYTEVVKLKAVNEGSLALKYQLGVNVANEVISTNVYGEELKLSSFIKYGIVDGAQTYTREQAVAAVDATATALETAYGSETIALAAGAEKIVTMVVYMPTAVGNDANAKKDAPVPTINLGINVLATQMTAEEDSFDATYDKNAWMDGMIVYDAADLQAAINAGGTVTLGADVELTEAVTVPAAPATFAMRATPAATVLNLNGKTINNANGYAIENQGNLVITGNGTISGLGCIRSKAGTITIENGNFLASSQWQNGVYQHTLKAENTAVIINGGNFDATVNGQTNAVLNASTGATITINGGTFKNVEGALTTFDPYLFHYENDGKVIINDGTFYGGWRFAGTTATTDIYGGNFTVGFDGQSFHANSTHVVTVYGGNFTVGTKLATKLPDILADGYQAVENAGVYVILPETDAAISPVAGHAGIYVDNANSKSYYVFDKIGLMNLNGLFAAINPNEANINTVNLMADVDLSGEDWAPINSMWIRFDGNDHTISNLKAGLSTDGRRSGFWAYAGAVTISNLTLENVNVTGSQAGAFAGGAEGLTLNNCFLKGINTINYIAGVETWCGIGAIAGVTTESTINAEIVDGATVTLNRGTMITDSGCAYIDDLTGHIQANKGTVTNNGTVTANGEIQFRVYNAAELAAAVAKGQTNIYLADGEYDAYGCGGKTLTINGTKNAVIKLYNEGEDGCDYAFGGNGTGVGSYVFNGVTIDTTSNTGNYKGFAYMKATFNNCDFVGAYSLNNANDFVFNGCNFDFKNGYFWTWGANSATFNECTFGGNSKAILAHGYSSTVITINNCKFVATEKGYTGAGDNTAAVEIDPAGTNTYTIKFTGENTITDSYAGWTRIKDGSTGHTITGVN